jgi:hypothetical protein
MWNCVGTLNMEATHSSETSALTRPTLRHIPEDGMLYVFYYAA